MKPLGEGGLARSRAERLQLSSEDLEQGSEYSLQLATVQDDLADHLAAWRELAEAAIDSNVYLTPEFLIPNLELVQDEPYVVAFLYRTSSTRSRHLVAVMPFCQKGPEWKRPFRHLVPLKNRYLWDPSPLLHPEGRGDTLSALVSQLSDPLHPWSSVELVLPCEPNLGERKNVLITRDIESTTILRKPLSQEEYRRRRGKSSLRSERRRRRQLGELGSIDVSVEHEVSGSLLDDFLLLESSGWKGHEGTAIRSRTADVLFLRTVTSAMEQEGRVMLVTMRLDDKLIGASLMLRLGTSLRAFKLCYDERLRRYSPGLLTASASIDCFLEDESLHTVTGAGSPESWQARFFLDVVSPVNVLLVRDSMLLRPFLKGLRIWRARCGQSRTRT